MFGIFVKYGSGARKQVLLVLPSAAMEVVCTDMFASNGGAAVGKADPGRVQPRSVGYQEKRVEMIDQ